jgi:hypothetical protein
VEVAIQQGPQPIVQLAPAAAAAPAAATIEASLPVQSATDEMQKNLPEAWSILSDDMKLGDGTPGPVHAILDTLGVRASQDLDELDLDDIKSIAGQLRKVQRKRFFRCLAITVD